MCDTFIALHSATIGGNVLLSKNSDREPDEAQAIVHLPWRQNTDRNLRCTFIDIPQIPESHACFLSKPFQMWGAEMGVNEWGLAIGNEAVFTKVKFEKKNLGLTGMDLLRLALERCKTATEAIDCITSLLEEFGQDACGGYKNKGFYYHNSFLITDAGSAWVLETAGRMWAAQPVNDIRSISNLLTIDQPQKFGAGAKALAQDKGWWDGKSAFSFKGAYSDWLYTRLGRAAQRQACTTTLASKKKGELSASDCMQILQTHNIDGNHFKPRKANTGSVCMHATGLLNPSQTTGSMVAELRSGRPHTIWLTGTSMPCLSVYVPYFFNTNVLANVVLPSAEPNQSLWWRAEKLHRWISKDYQNRKAMIHHELAILQRSFLEKERLLIDSNPITLEKFSRACLSQYEKAVDRWSQRIT